MAIATFIVSFASRSYSWVSFYGVIGVISWSLIISYFIERNKF
jgi:cytochrome c oxidase subunit IV